MQREHLLPAFLGVLLTAGVLAVPDAHAAPAKQGGTPVPVAAATAADTFHLKIETLGLDNGMTFLLVDRPGASRITAGWLARVGWADSPPGRTGLSHALEHMLYKGTETIGAGELDLIYGRAGATGLNALTNPDFTAFFVALPANELELWFWMESDRLLAPVFRDFDGEKKAIEAERRGTLEGRGRFADEMTAFFWQGLPYGAPRFGTPADLEATTEADALRHFRAFYGAGNLTAVLVGQLDRERVAELARRYFGRLPAAPAPVRPWPAVANPPRESERRKSVRYAGPPAVEILYPTVPFLHPDSYALEVAAAVLNARLYTSLVLESRLAGATAAEERSWQRAGSFAVSLEGQGTASTEALEKGWTERLATLEKDLVPARELAAVQNHLAAEACRQLVDPFLLLVEVLTDAGLGDGGYVNTHAARLAAVTAEDVRRVVRTYLRPENRTVLLYEPEAAAAPGGER